ncbi:hypothetical protein IGB42_02312 [Andreprevotia sp. IGB-42]|uniref:hypothetical protein n=1 Tax=Andreprevotia sp. IGB-42 TaxID=2497473 RepID=UPI00135BB6BE|nr:hypothetical protein [Andreprevotia sp. IGB-42]KAF0813383.1 hypothetical protein IGB42_02312 [Andreprevotia sp. IGB-42]
MNESQPSQVLTEDELLHLAIEASNRERYDLSIGYLKQALTHPGDLASRTSFLLGTQYAQIGMYVDAEQYMHQSIELDPGFEIAVFQLGLLQLTSGKADAARASWQGLDFLPADHCLKHFRQGLLALEQNSLADAEAALKQGLATPVDNVPLKAEMERILNNVIQMQLTTQANGAADGSGSDASDEHVFLSAYRS